MDFANSTAFRVFSTAGLAEINRRDECGNAISKPIDEQSPLAGAVGHSASLSLAEEVTNANSLQELTAFFSYWGVGAGVPLPDSPRLGPGVSIGGFWGCAADGRLITGGAFGIGASVPGVSVVSGRTYTWLTNTFSGLQALVANQLFEQLKQDAGAGFFLAALLAEFITSIIVKAQS